jgi:hypothetical protein
MNPTGMFVFRDTETLRFDDGFFAAGGGKLPRLPNVFLSSVIRFWSTQNFRFHNSSRILLTEENRSRDLVTNSIERFADIGAVIGIEVALLITRAITQTSLRGISK